MREHFSEVETVNLTLAITNINVWNRLAIALGNYSGACGGGGDSEEQGTRRNPGVLRCAQGWRHPRFGGTPWRVLLRAEGLTKIYPAVAKGAGTGGKDAGVRAGRGRWRAGEVVLFRGLDFAVAAGEMVAIVGESGSGKSSLLHLLAALDRPTRARCGWEASAGRCGWAD